MKDIYIVLSYYDKYGYQILLTIYVSTKLLVTLVPSL
jgi:hypothetical protein